ncbi:MAG: hypothetical protein GKR90_17635 [Pseudomonadales bacterium]|nr:hypothetical protein [Pseudomonadales bacterium]
MDGLTAASFRAIKGSTLNSITEHKQFEIRWSSEIGEVYRKAIDNPARLTRVEEFIMADWLTSSLVARENECYQYRQGLLDKDNWESSEKAVRMVLGFAWSRNWWDEVARVSFGDTFVDYVNENLIENVTDYGELLYNVSFTRGASDDT